MKNKEYINQQVEGNFKVLDTIEKVDVNHFFKHKVLQASSLMKILEGFKKAKKHKQFPHKLLMRDVLIQEDRIIKAIQK